MQEEDMEMMEEERRKRLREKEEEVRQRGVLVVLRVKLNFILWENKL